jgi:hypothetical protein
MNTPEHLHLALNHLPFLGAGFAIIPLAIGFITKNKNAVLSGLLIAALSGWLTPIVMETGESAYERYEKGPIAQFLDPQAEQFLETHEHRAGGVVQSNVCKCCNRNVVPWITPVETKLGCILIGRGHRFLPCGALFRNMDCRVWRTHPQA